MVKTKKFIGFILAVIVSLGLCLFSACAKNGGTKDAPQTVSYNFFISSTALSLEKGQSEKLECRYGDKQIVFTSSDTQVALVDQNGTVTAVAVGEAYITAKAEGRFRRGENLQNFRYRKQLCRYVRSRGRSERRTRRRAGYAGFHRDGV